MFRNRKITIEQISEMEYRFGVSLKGISVLLKQDEEITLEVMGEVYASSGNNIEQDITIVATALNSEGSVIGNETTHLYCDDFFNLEAFNMYFLELPEVPASVRIYPKAG